MPFCPGLADSPERDGIKQGSLAAPLPIFSAYESETVKPTIHDSANSLREALSSAAPASTLSPVAFVPTMGYLHEGHASLIRRAAELAPRVVVSIFVNPLQFGPQEDFERYPRDLERDVRVAGEAGATDIYVPGVAELTPPGLQITVDPGPMANVLCGASRPGHFRGVATIVTKLFNLVRPDVAVFGWKDAQQLLIIRKMVEDLNLPVRIEGVETIRDPDGLAMSSRNTYLSPEERKEAPVIQQGLQRALQLFRQGETSGERLAEAVRRHIGENSSGRIDYVSCVSRQDLQPVSVPRQGEVLLAAAVYFGKTRLIDNIRF